MTRFMFPMLLAVFFISCKTEVQISTTPDFLSGPIPAGQTVTINCKWTPGSRRTLYGDIIADNASVFDSISPYHDMIWGEDPDTRVVFIDESEQGAVSLIIKEVTEADAKTFECAVTRMGVSAGIKLDISE